MQLKYDRINRRYSREMEEAHAKAFAMKVKGFTEDGGRTVDEVTPFLSGKGKKSVRARYVNPENNDETYGCKGPKPKWLKERMEEMGLAPVKPDGTKEALEGYRA